MNSLETSLMMGRSVILEMHKHFQEGDSDDQNHIVNLSLIIRGISGYQTKMIVPEKEQIKVLSELKEYGKNLWVESCINASQEDEPEADFREESNYIFDYIFKHHEYPY